MDIQSPLGTVVGLGASAVPSIPQPKRRTKFRKLMNASLVGASSAISTLVPGAPLQSAAAASLAPEGRKVQAAQAALTGSMLGSLPGAALFTRQFFASNKKNIEDLKGKTFNDISDVTKAYLKNQKQLAKNFIKQPDLPSKAFQLFTNKIKGTLTKFKTFKVPAAALLAGSAIGSGIGYHRSTNMKKQGEFSKAELLFNKTAGPTAASVAETGQKVLKRTKELFSGNKMKSKIDAAKKSGKELDANEAGKEIVKVYATRGAAGTGAAAVLADAVIDKKAEYVFLKVAINAKALKLKAITIAQEAKATSDAVVKGTSKRVVKNKSLAPVDARWTSSGGKGTAANTSKSSKASAASTTSKSTKSTKATTSTAPAKTEQPAAKKGISLNAKLLGFGAGTTLAGIGIGRASKTGSVSARYLELVKGSRLKGLKQSKADYINKLKTVTSKLHKDHPKYTELLKNVEKEIKIETAKVVGTVVGTPTAAATLVGGAMSLNKKAEAVMSKLGKKYPYIDLAHDLELSRIREELQARAHARALQESPSGKWNKENAPEYSASSKKERSKQYRTATIPKTTGVGAALGA